MTLLLAGFLAGCSSTPTAPPASTAASAPATAPLTNPATAGAAVIEKFVFVPAALTVAAGAMVTVDNRDGANHTLTAIDGSFDTGNIPGHQEGTFTAPSKQGSYPYKCSIHPFMTGTLTVV